MIYTPNGELHAVDVVGGARVVKAVPPKFVDCLKIGPMLLDCRQDAVVLFLFVFAVDTFAGYTHHDRPERDL